MKHSSRKIFSNEALLAIGTRIKEARGSQTQAEFAARISVGRSVLSNYEAGRRLPNSEVLGRIAEWSGLSEKYILYGGEGELTRLPTEKISVENVWAHALVFAFYERLRSVIPFHSEHQKMLWWGDVSLSVLKYSERLISDLAQSNDEGYEVALKIALDSMGKQTDEELLNIVMGTAQQ